MKDFEQIQSFMNLTSESPEITENISNFDDFDIQSRINLEDFTPVTRKSNKGKLISTLDGQILDWDDQNVKIDVLINVERREFQNRLFPIILFRNSNFLNHGHFVRIMMYARKESMEVKFLDGMHLVNQALFEEDIELSSLESKMFKFE